MTISWQQGPLRSFAELISTGPFGSMLHKSDYVSGGVPLINPVNIVDDAIVPDLDKQVGVDAARRLSSYILRTGDIVVARRGEIGRCAVVRSVESGWVCGTGCFFIRPKPEVDPDFMAHLLRAPRYREMLERASTGTTMKNMSNATLAALPVSMPSAVEQRRIVAILDEAFAGIATAKANVEKNLQNAREIFSDQVDRTFASQDESWRVLALEDIGITQTGSTPKSSEPESLGSHTPFVKPGDFNRDGSIAYSNEGLSELGARKARLVRSGSTLMVCIGATIGKAGYNEREIATNQQVNSWTPSGSVSAKFVYYQMTSKDFQRRVRERSGQATLPIINKSKWSALEVAIPQTMCEQLKIVSTLDDLMEATMTLEEVYARKLTALDELKKSLLHEAFTGQL